MLPREDPGQPRQATLCPGSQGEHRYLEGSVHNSFHSLHCSGTALAGESQAINRRAMQLDLFGVQCGPMSQFIDASQASLIPTTIADPHWQGDAPGTVAADGPQTILSWHLPDISGQRQQGCIAVGT
jgi:hypothetical protein